MADNASDIAVLGFSVQTANAETAFKKITDGLDEINAKTKETDLALEQKVTQSLAKMKNTATVMSTLAENFAANEQGMTAVSTAFEKLANVAKGMSELKVQATSISNAIKVLNKSGVTDLAKDFEAAFGALEGNVKTVKIAADIVNKSEIEKILPSRVTVAIDPTTFNEMIGRLEEIKSWASGINIKVNPPDLTETKAKIDEVFRPTLSFGLKPADKLIESFNETVKPWVEKHIAIDIPLSFSLGDKSTVDKAVKEAVKQAPSNPADAFYEELAKEIESTKKGHALLKKHSPEWLGNILSEAFQYNQESFDWLLGSAGLPNDIQATLAERLGEIRRDMDDIWEPKKPSAAKPSEEKTAENLGVNPDTIENIIQGIKDKISPHIGEIQGMFALQPTFTTDAFYASYDPWLQKVSKDAEELAKKLVFTPVISLPDGGKKGHKWISSKDVQDALGLTPKGGRESVLAKFAESLSDDRGKLNEMLDFKITVEPVNDETMQNVKKFTDMVEKLKDAFHTLNEDSKGVAENIAAIDKSMSAQVKTLLQATGKKAAASELDKLYAESEQAAKLEKEIKDWQKLLEVETAPLDTKNSEDRVKRFKELANALLGMERTQGSFAKNMEQQSTEQTNVINKFATGWMRVDDTVKKMSDTAGKSVQNMRAQANALYRTATSSADAKAAFKELDAVVKQFSWRIDNLPRIEPTKLTDPFVKLKAELGDTNSRLVDIGRTFGLYLSGRSIISYFKQASESANNFQMEIRRIQSLALDFDFGELRNGLMDLDARFGSVIHNAQALYMAYTSGVRGSEKDLVGFTETMSKLATTVKSDVLPTIDAVTSVMNAWNLSANSANEIADLIFSTIKYGKSNAAQLTTSLGHVVAPAAALNLQLDELGASIAVLTKTMKTNRAMTYLSNILGKMASPTKAVQEAAAELGIELSANSIKARGFAQTLKDIRLATGGDIAKIAKIFPDLRGQRAALTLLGTQYKDFEDQLVNMRNKAGSMEEALSKITDTPEAQLRALKNTWSMFGIEVGKTVNEMVTLGGALGPVLEQLNGLGHTGRAVMGNLIASAGALGGIAVASKAVQAANFARLQMSYQMASAEADTHRLEMDNALLKERQALESAKILAANLKSEVVQKQLNDETLRKLKAEDEIYRTTIKRNNVELAGEQARAKFVDDRMKREFALRTASMGESQNRITALGGWLTELTTGKGQQKIRDARNLVDRMRLDIEKDQAMLQGEAADLQKKYADAIQNLVEHSAEIRKLMHQAIRDGNLGDRENLNSFYGKIVSTIKSNTVIASQMEQFDQGERILQREMRRVILAEESKKLVEGENYEHSLLVQFVKDEIQIEQSKLNTQQANLRTMIQQNGVNEETAKLMDDIAQRKLDIIALEAKHNTIQEMIQTRTDALVGREADQVRMLEAANKAAKQLLDANNTDLETLKKKAEIEMKNAAVLGGATLAAVRNAFNAQMDYRSVAMQINALEAERATLIDDEGRMINESEDAVKRVAEIDKQRVALQQKRVDLEREFVALGVKAGNQDARNLKILQLDKAGVGLAGAVDALTRDKGVVSEAIKAMSKDVGKNIFGGAFSGTAMRSASVGMSFIPGLSKYAMPLAMMSSMDIVGKTTGGFARLSGIMLKTLGTTEKLQKNGMFPLDKGVEDLTKNVLQSTVSIKGIVTGLKGLKALGLAGGSKALLASLTGPTGLVAGLGAALITVVAGGLAYAFSQTEKGGPLGDIAESMFGVGKLERNNKAMDMRLEILKENTMANDELVRQMERISASLPQGVANIEQLKAQLATIHESISEQMVDGNKALLDAQRSYVKSLSASMEKNKYDIGALKWKNASLNQKLAKEEQKLSKESVARWQNYNQKLYDFYSGYVRNNDNFIRTLLKESATWNKDIWDKAVKDVMKHKTIIKDDIASDKAPVDRRMYDYAKKNLEQLVKKFAYENLMKNFPLSIDNTGVEPEEFYLDSVFKQQVKKLNSPDVLGRVNTPWMENLEIDPKLVDQETWDRYVYLRESMRGALDAQVADAKKIIRDMEAIEALEPVEGVDYQKVQTLADRLKEEPAKPDHLLFESLLAGLEELKSNLPDNLGLFASVQTNINSIMQMMSGNKSEIKRLASDSKAMQQHLRAAILVERQMSDAYKSIEPAEKGLREALNGMAKNIQSQIDFDIRVAQYQQKNMQRVNEAIDKLKNTKWRSAVTMTRRAEDKIAEIKKDREKYLESIAQGDAFLLAPTEETQKILEQYDEDIKEQQNLIAYWAKEKSKYDRWLEGVAEARYQILREQLEASRDSAFAPMKDTEGKLNLAKKMTNMAWNRLGYVLGTGGELADLTGKTAEDVEEMVRKMNESLSTPMQKAKDELDTYKEGLAKLTEGTNAYDEHNKKVQKAQSDYDAKFKEWNEKTELLQSSLQDFYGKVASEASLFVQNMLDKNKDRLSRAKYLSMFDEGFGSLRVQAENIANIKKTMDDVEKQYAERSGIFDKSKMNFIKARETKDDLLRGLDKELMQSRTTYVELLKGVNQSLVTFMEQISTDVQNQAKSLFDFRMSNPRFAGMRPQMIKNRMGLLNQLLYGQNGKGGVMAARNKALEDAKRLQGLGDPVAAMKYLQEAQQWQQKGVGIEQQKFDLLKMQADTEKDINSSMYQLANTLRKTFEATSQAAIEVDSIEGIRLTSRRLGENIAPPTIYAKQDQLAAQYDNMMQQQMKNSKELETIGISLMQQAHDLFKDKDTTGGKVNINQAATHLDTAADALERASKNIQTQIKVVRI